MKVISEKNPRIIFDREEIFSDNEKKKRSGHLGNAMVECKDGSIIAFYPNVSHTLPSVYPGHSMYGWMEYRRSYDRGITWSDPEILKYSWDEFLEGYYKIGVEKAVVTDEGTIVLLCLRSVSPTSFEPYTNPTSIRSTDGGKTWSEAVEVGPLAGRIYDALYRDGRIYALEYCNSTDESFYGTPKAKEVEPDLSYKIYASDDNGATFYEYSTIPFDTMDHGYGNLIFREDGSLVFYAHNFVDEQNLTCYISSDDGKTWEGPIKSPTVKGSRNPQVGFINGRYILHCRGLKMRDFVFYHSEDGINWDEGTIVSGLGRDGKPISGCYYSNNLVVRGDDGVDRMLIQYSEQFVPNTGKFNIKHAWLECSWE